MNQQLCATGSCTQGCDNTGDVVMSQLRGGLQLGGGTRTMSQCLEGLVCLIGRFKRFKDCPYLH